MHEDRTICSKGFLIDLRRRHANPIAYAMGGKGVISVLANAFPVIFKKIKEHSFAGNYSKASDEQFKILDINSPMYEEGNPVGVKYVMSLMGLCQPFVRLPLLEASTSLQKRIQKLYANMKK